VWSIVGAPYVGKYRRASVVHDFHVGEGENPNVSRSKRREADKMFYQACRTDKCSVKFAAILYLAVSIGTWFSKKYPSKSAIDKNGEEEFIKSFDESASQILYKFNAVYEALMERKLKSLAEMDFEELEKAIHDELYVKIKIGDKYYSGIRVSPEELQQEDIITLDNAQLCKLESDKKILIGNKIKLKNGASITIPNTGLIMKLEGEWLGN
jgi:hypothetical protein